MDSINILLCYVIEVGFRILAYIIFYTMTSTEFKSHTVAAISPANPHRLFKATLSPPLRIPVNISHLHLKECNCNNWADLFTPLRLKKLWINYCNLDDDAIANLAPSLPGIEEICLSKNRITDRGATELAKTLGEEIKILNISCNKVGDEGALAIVCCLPQLNKLSLDGNFLSPGCKQMIRHLLLKLIYLTL